MHHKSISRSLIEFRLCASFILKIGVFVDMPYSLNVLQKHLFQLSFYFLIFDVNFFKELFNFVLLKSIEVFR